MKILHFSSNFSKQRSLISNFTTMTIVKLCCHNFTQSTYFMIFSAPSIFYRPTDLSLLKEFFKNVSISSSYKLPSQSAVQKISMSTHYRKKLTLLEFCKRITGPVEPRGQDFVRIRTEPAPLLDPVLYIASPSDFNTCCPRFTRYPL